MYLRGTLSKKHLKKNKIGNIRTFSENNIVNDATQALKFAFKETTEKVCSQDELTIVVITTMDFKTFFQAYSVYKDTWIPKEGKQIEVFMEPDNPIDKFTICVKVKKKFVGHLKKVLREDLKKQYFSFCVVIHTKIVLCKSLETV